jgi:hypothetical protein
MTTRIAWTAASAATALLAAQTAAAQQSGCIAHHPNYIDNVFEVTYDSGCSGHDEPELDPVSNAPGSARDLTWTVVLPTNGQTFVDSVGPTFWWGGTVTDPNSLFGQAFLEVQFYPNSVVTNCGPAGSFVVDYSPGDYSVCSPVWKLTATGQPGVFHETAAFNAMLTDSATGGPLVMHEGHTITIHFYVTPANDGFHVTVTDLNTNHTGTIVLNSKKDGPLMPAFDTQQIGNALAWGLVYDTPNSFVWEIGHTSPFTAPAAQFCLPGQTFCDSYDASHWAGFGLPLTIKGVTFGDGSSPKNWAAVSDFGGKAEVNQYCGASAYGQPFCIYPWFTLGSSGYHYGVDYPDTLKDFRQADQFAQTLKCGGPFGPDSTYCATILR